MTDNFEAKKRILDTIKQHDRIIISRHIRPDGDAKGSTLGLARMLRQTFPEKEVLVLNDDPEEYKGIYLSFLGEEDKTKDDEFIRSALLIALDCATFDRLAFDKADLCRNIIKIDHHIITVNYGDFFWIEDERSSVCEMVADFWYTFKDELKMDKETATLLYTGIVTDSGRFKFDCTSPSTLRLAAELLSFGIDTDTLFAHLYLEDFEYLKMQSEIYSITERSENGVAWFCLTQEMQKKHGLNSEQASNTISFIEKIKGSLIWIAFIENTDGSIRVRLRSRFVTVNKLAEKYRGGGHKKASGATVYNNEEILSLVKDADAILKDYKQNNEGWL